MSVPVTVDSDDLEALLHATGAIKAIEAALKQAKDDPFLDRVKPRITAAHDRIANAWRGALQGEQYPERFSAPTESEVAMLLALYIRGAGDRDGTDAFEPNEHRDLMVRGFIEYGVLRLHIAWSSSGEAINLESPTRSIRLTPRGLEAVAPMISAASEHLDGRKSLLRRMRDLLDAPSAS